MGIKSIFGKKEKKSAVVDEGLGIKAAEPANEHQTCTNGDTSASILTPEQLKKWSQPLLAPGSYGKFPPSFNLEFAAPSDSKLKYYFALAIDHAGYNIPFYAVTFDRREDWAVILHSRPNIFSEPLGLSGQEKAFRSASIIGLPRMTQEGETNHLERMTMHAGWSLHTDTWSIAVPEPAGAEGYRIEEFQWRKKPGDDENKMFDIRLARLSTSTPEEEDIVCRWIGAPWYRTKKSNVVGTLSFSGSGATGELGPRWTLMVVMTMLRKVNMDMHWNEMGAVAKSGAGLAGKAASLAVKIGVEVAMNV